MCTHAQTHTRAIPAQFSYDSRVRTRQSHQNCARIVRTRTRNKTHSHDSRTILTLFYNYMRIIRVHIPKKSHALGRFQRNSRIIREYMCDNCTRFAPESYERKNRRTRTRTIKVWFYYCTRIVSVFSIQQIHANPSPYFPYKKHSLGGKFIVKTLTNDRFCRNHSKLFFLIFFFEII